MDSMDNVRKRCEALEQRTRPLQQHTRLVERWRRWGRNPWRVAAVAALGLALACPFTGQAKTFHCGAGDVQCLIDAIDEANGNGGKNRIRLAAGTYTLTAIHNGTTHDTNGLPVITSPLTIVGAGATTTIIERDVSTPPFRLLKVAATGSLSLEGLTLRGGALSRESNIGGEGGGIFTDGTVTLTNCTLTDNMAILGGGIYTNNGTVTITNCLLVPLQG
jgi:hypothetical protein